MNRVRNLAINAADHLVAKKRLDAAASILENYLSAHEESADILRRLGRIRLELKQPEEAARHLRRALEVYAETQEPEAPAPAKTAVQDA